MQIKDGQKLHLVYEAGEGKDDQHLVKAGHISSPICGRGFDKNGNYKMTINVPLGHACKRCLKIANNRLEKVKDQIDDREEHQTRIKLSQIIRDLGSVNIQIGNL